MERLKDFKKEIRWLLRDKYSWDDLKIDSYLREDVIWESPESGDSHIIKDIKRILNGEPVAYVIGWVEFLGCKIEVNKNVLIPRPETEYWVSELIRKGSDPVQGRTLPKILDLCCGSGCIGIALLKHLPYVHVTFADISQSALEQTQKNLELNKIPNNRYTLIQSDLFSNIAEKFHLIVCNPPYVSIKETNNDLKWEPKKALYAGEDGLDVINILIDVVPVHLIRETPESGVSHLASSFYMEFEKDQEKKIEELLKSSKFKDYSFHKDQYGIIRYLQANI